MNCHGQIFKVTLFPVTYSASVEEYSQETAHNLKKMGGASNTALIAFFSERGFFLAPLRIIELSFSCVSHQEKKAVV